jgi:hypothetical protein
MGWLLPLFTCSVGCAHVACHGLHNNLKVSGTQHTQVQAVRPSTQDTCLTAFRFPQERLIEPVGCRGRDASASGPTHVHL